MENSLSRNLNLELPVRKRRQSGELFTVFDVSKSFGCSYYKVQNREHRGLLPKRVKIDKRLYWLPCHLEALKAGLTTAIEWKMYKTESKLNADDLKRLLKLREQGLSQAECGREVGLSQGQISRILAKLSK
jgi:hypothetical protein